MNKGIWGLAIALAFVAGSIVTGTLAFADKDDKNPFKHIAQQLENISKAIEGIGTIKGDQGEQGPLGPQGEQGEQGETGPSGSMTVYEVSGIAVISAGTVIGPVIQIRCLEGDSFNEGDRNVVMSVDPSVDISPRNIQRTQYTALFENDPSVETTGTRVIGAEVTPRLNGGSLPFDVPVIATGLCLSPSS